MSNAVSTARFRLLCREVAAKVNARSGRGETTRGAVLLELLRRVESHLGRKPSALPDGGAGGEASVRETLGRLVDETQGTSWVDIAEAELLGKVTVRSEGGAKGSAV